MTIYDGIMALIVVYTVIHGFWRGAAWQIAPIVSLVAGYMIAMPMSVTTAHWFGPPPLNRLFSLVTIYILVSLVVYLFFRSFREGVEKAQLTEFDRHLGAILGGVKGVLVTLSATCILLIYFPPAREIILKSESSTIAAKLISKIYPILPQAMHKLLDPYLKQLDDQIPIDFNDRHIDSHGFERTSTSSRQNVRSTQQKFVAPNHDTSSRRLRSSPPQNEFNQPSAFDQPTTRRRFESRTPTPRESVESSRDSFEEIPSSTRNASRPQERETDEPPATTRPKRPVIRSAEAVEEDDPFEVGNPNRTETRLR